MLRLSAILFLFLTIYNTSVSQESFDYKGYDIGRNSNIYELIDDAAYNGMDFITFSHDVCMEWYEINTNHENYANYAKELGLEVYFWNHVVSRPPSKFLKAGKLDLNNSLFWEWLYQTYLELMDKIPSATGIVISFTEAGYQIHRSNFEPEQSYGGVISDQQPVEIIERAIKTIYAAIKTKGGKLIVRDFWRTNTEYGYLFDALKNCPKDIMVYTKHVCNDFRYNYPIGLSIGKYSERLQIIEIEPSKPDPAYYQEQLQIVYELGARGVCPRIRKNSSIYRNFNNYCYKKVWAHNIFGTIDTLWNSTNFTEIDQQAMANYIKCLRGTSYIWDSYVGKNLEIQNKRLYKGESRPLYTDDTITHENDLRIRGIRGINWGDSAKNEILWWTEQSNYWAEKVQSSAIKEEFQELAAYGTQFALLAKNYIIENHDILYSEEYVKPPYAPDSLTLSILSNCSIRIDWKDNSENERKFKIERKDPSGFMRQIALVDKNETTFIDSGLRSNTTYEYRIRAYANASKMWNSAYTINKSITTTGISEPKKPTISITNPLQDFRYLKDSIIHIQYVLNDPNLVVVDIELWINNEFHSVFSNENNFIEFPLNELENLHVKVIGIDQKNKMQCSDSISIKVVDKITEIQEIKRSSSSFINDTWNQQLIVRGNNSQEIVIFSILGKQLISKKFNTEVIISYKELNNYKGVILAKTNKQTHKAIIGY